MEVAEHCIALPPPNYPDRFRVDSFREEHHRPSRSEGARTNVLWRGDDGRAGRADHIADGCHDISAADRDPLVLVEYCHGRSSAGGAVTSKVCEAAKQRCHRIALGMAYSAVVDGFSLDTIFEW